MQQVCIIEHYVRGQLQTWCPDTLRTCIREIKPNRSPIHLPFLLSLKQSSAFSQLYRDNRWHRGYRLLSTSMLPMPLCKLYTRNYLPILPVQLEFRMSAKENAGQVNSGYINLYTLILCLLSPTPSNLRLPHWQVCWAFSLSRNFCKPCHNPLVFRLS